VVKPICLLLPLISVLGCSEVEFGTVTGVVTIDGEPAPEVMVTFRPVDGRRESIAVTDARGAYELHYSLQRMGAWIGAHNVSLSTLELRPGKQGVRVAQEETIPARYNVDTELTADVVAGENVFDFALSSDGEIRLPDFLGPQPIEFEDESNAADETDVLEPGPDSEDGDVDR